MYYLFIYDHLVSQWNVSSIQAETLSYPLHCPQSIQCVFSKHFKINNLLNCVCVCVCVCVYRNYRRNYTINGRFWQAQEDGMLWAGMRHSRMPSTSFTWQLYHHYVLLEPKSHDQNKRTQITELNTVLHSFIFTVSFSSHPNKTDLFSI